jgi:osmotically inducible protein OsmC
MELQLWEVVRFRERQIGPFLLWGVKSMAAVSRADAVWEGDLPTGKGRVKVASGTFDEFPVTWASRAERHPGATSPEELLAAAHAACYSMAFSNGLSKAGHKVEELNTTAEVEFVPGTGITSSTLTVRGRVAGIDDAEFQRLAEEAKEGCPVSKALHGNVKLSVDARLEQ